MKHLIRYNESDDNDNDNKLDIKYIESCFAELIDNYIDYNNGYLGRNSWTKNPITSSLEYGAEDYYNNESWSMRLLLEGTPTNMSDDVSDGSIKTSGVHRSSYRIGYKLGKLVKDANEKLEILKEIEVGVKRIKEKYPSYNIDFNKQFTHGKDTQTTIQEFIVVGISQPHSDRLRQVKYNWRDS
jgi:hypothetical protein